MSTQENSDKKVEASLDDLRKDISTTSSDNSLDQEKAIEKAEAEDPVKDGESLQRSFFGKLFAAVGDFLRGIFNAAEKAWNKLDPEVQQAFTWGSKVLELINVNKEAAPDFLIELIQKHFPTLTKEKLFTGLNKVAEGLNVAQAIEADTLEETLLNLQKYFSTLKGATWAGVSALGAKLLAFAFAPAGTKWATFESLMEYVYQTYIKKDS